MSNFGMTALTTEPLALAQCKTMQLRQFQLASWVNIWLDSLSLEIGPVSAIPFAEGIPCGDESVSFSSEFNTLLTTRTNSMRNGGCTRAKVGYLGRWQ